MQDDLLDKTELLCERDYALIKKLLINANVEFDEEYVGTHRVIRITHIDCCDACYTEFWFSITEKYKLTNVKGYISDGLESVNVCKDDF